MRIRIVRLDDYAKSSIQIFYIEITIKNQVFHRYIFDVFIKNTIANKESSKKIAEYSKMIKQLCMLILKFAPIFIQNYLPEPFIFGITCLLNVYIFLNCVKIHAEKFFPKNEVRHGGQKKLSFRKN